MTVTVYTSPGCPGCNLTKRKLKDLGVDYTEEPMNDAVVDEVKAVASPGERLMAPIVRAGEQLWAGFRPDRITALAAAVIA
jgi:glutaredoxin-like protein NrdH